MIESIRYHWQLQKLEKECSKIEETYEKIKKKKKLSITELENLNSEESSEVWPVFEKIDALKTSRFCQIANRLMVPLPEHRDELLWKDLHYIGGRALTDKGFWELKKLIRQEKRERRDAFGMWLAALIGIIGAITGLVAVLRR